MENNIFMFILVGFIAQMIDGALGMAYGVSSNTFLLSIGIPPALASASVHLAEVFTTGISGFSHWKFGNVDKDLIKKLVIPGILGGITGAYVLTSIPTDIIKPLVSIYLLIMGIIILIKSLRPKKDEYKAISTSRLSFLGIIGGFFDAIGGGGWGPIVTTTLVAKGKNPRYAIGSVNATEFAVTLAESLTFAIFLKVVHWEIVIGLLIGGMIAAPLGAYATQKLPLRTLMGMLAGLIIVLSLRTLIMTFI